MAIRDVIPMPFIPAGLSDSRDGNMSKKGGMLSCQNLMPSPATPGILIPRPAAFKVIDFVAGGFSSPGYISAMVQAGTRIYGTIATARNAGRDEPFCYDFATNSFVTVAGVTASNTPTSPASTGAWTPPSMCQVGPTILLAHPGFSGAASGNYFGWFDTSGFSLSSLTGTTHGTTTIDTLSANPLTLGVQPGQQITGTNIPAGTRITAVTASSIILSQAATGSGSGVALTITGGTFMSPLWCAGNTNTNGLPSVPTFCANFNNRVYFACANLAYFTDVLVPTQITNATNFLTIGGNGDPITSMAPQPYFATNTGGIAQALLIFKAFQIWQVQGDLALSTLSLNQVIQGVGTQSPRSPAVTPNGIAFLAIDGIRNVGLDGQVSIPVGEVVVPFITALTPSRTAAAYNQGVYRAVVDFLEGGVYEKFEYWWDEIREIWTGPHTLTYDNIIPYGSSFLVTSTTNTGAIYQTNVLPGAADSFSEFGSQLTFTYQTGVLSEDTSILSEKALIEHTIFMGFDTELTLTFKALDPSYNTFSTYQVTTPLVAPSQPTTYGVFWPGPIVFNRMSVQITGNSASGLQLGAMYLHYQALGYINVDTNISSAIATSYDYGSVADPVLTSTGDWGAVADLALSVVDFGPTGILP